MNKAENVIKYYVLCNKLKNIIRTGWIDWGIKKDRVESVAEHIYSAQMLAIAMKSEYNYDINLEKVILMLAIHEIEEITIGDLTPFQISSEEKQKLGHEAVEKTLLLLLDRQKLKSIIFEFDERKTKEARFAFYCDKLDADLQAKLYDEEGLIDLNKQENNSTFDDPLVQELLNSGMSFSQMWLTFDQRKYNYDDNFMEVSKYAFDNKINTL
ncbi:MAG: HD domain-containing protein [bacterium]|nr:HD domain-containing protein [bacterium]